MCVLLVEDTEELRYVLARALRLHRCVVRETANGQAGVEAVAVFSPNLVVTDLMMPGMDRIELIGRLRAIPEMASVPVV